MDGVGGHWTNDAFVPFPHYVIGSLIEVEDRWSELRSTNEDHVFRARRERWNADGFLPQFADPTARCHQRQLAARRTLHRLLDLKRRIGEDVALLRIPPSLGFDTLAEDDGICFFDLFIERSSRRDCRVR